MKDVRKVDGCSFLGGNLCKHLYEDWKNIYVIESNNKDACMYKTCDARALPLVGQ